MLIFWFTGVLIVVLRLRFPLQNVAHEVLAFASHIYLCCGEDESGRLVGFLMCTLVADCTGLEYFQHTAKLCGVSTKHYFTEVRSFLGWLIPSLTLWRCQGQHTLLLDHEWATHHSLLLVFACLLMFGTRRQSGCSVPSCHVCAFEQQWTCFHQSMTDLADRKCMVALVCTLIMMILLVRVASLKGWLLGHREHPAQKGGAPIGRDWK